MQPVFIDFEASSLSPASWPIEVGLAKIDNDEIVVKSRLIRPHDSWAMSEWHLESTEVHGIQLEELSVAAPAEEVAHWLSLEVEGCLLVSDAPEFDQRWLDRLLETLSTDHDLKLADFDQVVWWAFSEEQGNLKPGGLHNVYSELTNRCSTHRAGDDAADLARAWLAGCR
ncbi:exonuclease superfamily [Rhodobacterales bacterium Y4I]|nr:exonuclease superfamily [Rhodobacterales bacterium Y4I]